MKTIKKKKREKKIKHKEILFQAFHCVRLFIRNGRGREVDMRKNEEAEEESVKQKIETFINVSE